MSGPLIARRKTSGVDLKSTLLHYWNCDTDAATMNDLHGSINLTKTGAAGSVSNVAPDGGACFINAENSYYRNASVPKIAAYDNDVTLNCWVFTASATAFGRGVMEHVNSGATVVYYLFRIARTTENADRWDFRNSSNTAVRIDVSPYESIEKWNMFTGVKTKTGVKLYINGVLSGSQSGDLSTVQSGNGILTVGAFFGGTGIQQRTFAAGIWEGELTQQQITALYNSGQGKRYAAL
jgi:hypothetical protein